MERIKLQIAEIDRQRARLDAAASLYREVLNNYGVSYLQYLTPLEDIVKDTQNITLINYFNV